ncbi:hypothetical protein C5L39_01730 [Corynebacterium alimapuense]|uniref:FCS-type domain-containing protein n=1 Tax=Corynebacterium alimapuense TaxID=1576874 RepID=A0A3M8KB15_9CORY|nr:hypothetical protein [Corynebacterium alimapuense]RNE49722.1 hypothetical protein C5L39_01730 [Corynebacterium alimapuense]
MSRTQHTSVCAWCGKELGSSGRGRPRKYCGRSCKQRAYEQRHKITGTNIPQEAVIIHPDRAAALRDSLFELRCAAEDIATASAEGAEPDELRDLCTELVSLARAIEKLR